MKHDRKPNRFGRLAQTPVWITENYADCREFRATPGVLAVNAVPAQSKSPALFTDTVGIPDRTCYRVRY
jgi:hypothetical protein